ncbi:MAG: inositol monophosphatase family protein [Thermonemataceae bacterium]|nr:inositol monophosphatase family protein [Thermonemataceae bacterium]
MISLINLCEDVVSLAKDVGKFILQEQQNFETKYIEHKGLNDLVSYVDKQAEERICLRLAQLLPEAGFITEENPENQIISNREYHWIVDPLDGTTNFIHKLPIFAISIALMKEKEIVLGVVYEINKDECFYAIKNGGAFCNNKVIEISGNKTLAASLVATGFPYHFFGKNIQYLQILNDLMQKTQGLRRLGSAAVDLAYVACGRFEAFFEFNLKPWDVAAGALLVQEAGGKVGKFDASEDFVFGKEILAAESNIFLEMQEVIAKYWI